MCMFGTESSLHLSRMSTFEGAHKRGYIALLSPSLMCSLITPQSLCVCVCVCVCLQTSFWVVREILNEPLAKVRAELVTQFIKIAKVSRQCTMSLNAGL